MSVVQCSPRRRVGGYGRGPRLSERIGVAGGPADGVDFAAIFASQPTAYLVLSPELIIVEANEAYLRLLGRTREELIGRPVFEAFPPAPDTLDEDGNNPLQLSFERARDTCLPDQMPLFHYDVLDRATGQMVHRVWSLISAPVLDKRGETQLILQRVEDVSDYAAALERHTGRERAWSRLEVLEADLYARAQELRAALSAQETATRRLAGMAQVALQLAAAETITGLTETIVRAGLTALGADGGAIGVRDEDHGVVRVTVTDALGGEVQRRFGVLPRDSRLPAAWAASTGEQLLLGTRAAGLAWSPAMSEVYESTSRHAWVAVPLRVGDRLLGSLVAGWTDEREFSQDEIELIEAFAAQCAQALLRLQVLAAERTRAEVSRQLSESLQRSLLTEPPPLEHVHIAVRYRPAGAGAQIGGDWYDAFLTGNGDLTLVIGDVTGHDRIAAAAMAQMRNVLRGVAQTVIEPPAVVLAALDETLQKLHMHTLATAVLAQVRQDNGQAAAGICAVRWSNAGHPPPLLLSAGGATLLEHEPNLLLGLRPDTPRHDHEILLPAEATLLLYTDGLVERRGHDLDEGTERLRAAATDLAHLPVDELCDALLDRLAPHPADDVALLALRVRSATRDECTDLRADSLRR
jgi:PAS domain S-box-containing protein